MALIREWIARLRGTLRPFGRDADLEEETAQRMEHLRDQRGLPWLRDFSRDIAYGLRTLRRSPLFTTVAVATLALGIGANTAIFSLADAVLLRALPVTRPQELVLLRQVGANGNTIMPFTSGAAEHFRLDHEALAGLTAFRPMPSTQVRANGVTEFALAQLVSGNYHELLGVTPVLGRTLTEQDREPVAVISHRYWHTRFAGDPRVIGRTLEMQGRSFTIVGVTPSQFFGTQPGRHVDVTAPLAARTMALPPNARWLYLLGRLADGVSPDQAKARLRALWAQLPDAQLSGPRPPVTLEIDSGAQGLNELRREFSLPLRILMAAVGLVLLLACANLAGLLIARSSARGREIAIRTSLGAGRLRIVRQLLTENALLAAAGGIAGGMLAFAITDFLLAMMSLGRAPVLLDVSPNLRVFGFAAAVTLVTAALFGLLPAIGATRIDVQPQLKQVGAGDVGRSLWVRTMVAAQVALLMLLLTTAGLFVRTLQKLHAVDSGFRQEEVLLVTVSGGFAQRGNSRALLDELHGRFSALPGVQSVSQSMDTPLGGEMSMAAGLSIPGQALESTSAPPVYHNFVGSRFFETMGVPIIAGRDFDERDDVRSAKVVVISDSVARRYFADRDPLGSQVVFQETLATIVGVVKDVRYASLRTDAPMVIYRPYRQQSSAPANTFLIRTSSSRAALAPLLQAEIRAAAPTIAIPSVGSLEDQLAAALLDERMLAFLSSALGVLAVVLAAIGVYGTAAGAVARRRREIGIRMALGARPAQVVSLVAREAFGVVAVGLAVGIPVALAAGWASRSILTGVLFQLSSTDPLVLSWATMGILIVGLLSAYLPARRASRIDPVAVVRQE
jgi:predicted permease